MNKLPLWEKIFAGYYVLLIIFATSFALRLALRSNYLDDFDSVSFVLALKNFSLMLQQPQPPGYPVYVFLGRAVNLFFRDGVQSLTFLSALFGSLSLIPTYLLAKKFFDDKTAILAAIILSLTPATLLYSEVAMTDIVSMFFIVTTVYLLYLGLSSSRSFFVSSFVLGIAIGVRQTDIVLLPLFLITALYRKRIIDLIYSSIILLTAIGLWLVPMILDTGLSDFVTFQRNQGLMAQNFGTFHSYGWLNLHGLMVTLRHLFSMFITGWSSVIFIFLALAIIAIIIKVNMHDIMRWDRRVMFILGWTIPYLLLFVFVYTLENAYVRYILPVFPALAIVFAFSMVTTLSVFRRGWQRSLIIMLFALMISMMGFQAISQSYELHNSIPAPVKAAQFIKEHYDYRDTIVIAGVSFRHFQYYLPEYVLYLSWITKPNDISKYFIENGTILYEEDTIGFDNSGWVNQFERDYRIYPKHERVRLYEYNASSKGAALISKEDGWYGLETYNNNSTRWMNNDAYLILYSNENRTTELSLEASSIFRNRTIEVYSGDVLAAKTNVPGVFKAIKVPLYLMRGTNKVKLHVPEGCDMPCRMPDMSSTDCRCLSLVIQNVRLNSKDGSG